MRRRLLWGLLALYVLLAIPYAVTLPLFESPDESSHLQVIAFIAREWRWPPYQIPEVRAETGADMAWLISYHDPPLYVAPPLYHTLAAVLTAWSPMDDLSDRLIPSPSWAAGFAPQRGSQPWNKNVFVHLPGETLMGSSTVRAVAVLRGVSIVLGGVVVFSAYALADEIWPACPGIALGAAAWVAFNPQFLASHSGVSNDPLMNALCAVSLLGVVRTLRRGRGWSHWAGLGGVVGLGLLTKQSALLLLPVGALGAYLSAQAGEGGSLRVDRRAGLWVSPWVGLGRAAAFGAAALLVGGGWYLSNFIRHGDVLATQPHYAIQTPLARFGWEALGATLASYWAAFGWALITAPGWLYAGVGAVVVVALAGLIKWGVGRGRDSVSGFGRLALALLALAFLVNAASFVHWATATGAPYGRLLFPTAAPVGVLLAWGLAQWWPGAPDSKLRRWVKLGGGGIVLLAVGAPVLLGGAALSPWLLLRPAYRSPYRPGGVPRTATPLTDVAAGGVSLVGYESIGETVERGERVRVTLYWRAEMAIDQRLTLSAQLRGLDPTARIADDTRWLGGTLYPAQYWQPGDVVAHTVILQVPEWAPAPTLTWLDLYLLDEDDRRIPLAPNGQDGVSLGPWRITGAVEIPDTAVAVEATLGDAIYLDAYEARWEADGRLSVDLYWRAVATPERDMTVFVHWIGPTGTLVAQDDGPPADGAYPTSWWQAGDVIRDPRIIEAPEGPVAGALRVGMYEPSTGERLPAGDANGRRFPDDAVLLSLPE